MRVAVSWCRDLNLPMAGAPLPAVKDLSAASADDVALHEAENKAPALTRNITLDTQGGGSLASESPGFVHVGKKTGVKIPDSPQGITKEWLTQVYKNRGYLSEGGEVTEVDIPLFAEKGVKGNLNRYKICLQLRISKTTVFRLKSISKNPENI